MKPTVTPQILVLWAFLFLVQDSVNAASILVEGKEIDIGIVIKGNASFSNAFNSNKVGALVSGSEALVTSRPSKLTRIAPADMKSASELLLTLNSSAVVETADFDLPFFISSGRHPGEPNEASWPSQHWGLKRINIEAAWNTAVGTQEVIVAVIDTGIDYNHRDLVDNIWVNSNEIPNNGVDDDLNGFIDDYYGINVCNGGNGKHDPMDDNGHGTHVAGTIGAVGNNNTDLVGVNWTVRLMAIKAFCQNGQAKMGDIVEAINYSILMGAHIVNASWNLPNRILEEIRSQLALEGFDLSRILRSAIQRAAEREVLFIAAAGNDGDDIDARPSPPGSYALKNMLTVAATGIGDDLWANSNWGDTSVSIAAPGVNIAGLRPGNLTAIDAGTSFAAPLVSGCAALIRSRPERVSSAEIKSRILKSGEKLGFLAGKVQSSSLLDCGKAVTFR